VFRFHPVAYITFGYVFSNVSLHIVPPEPPLHFHIHLGITWMNGIWHLMGVLKNQLPENGIIGYIDPFLEPNGSLLIFTKAICFTFLQSVPDFL
jgi:hypothetical protein